MRAVDLAVDVAPNFKRGRSRFVAPVLFHFILLIAVEVLPAETISLSVSGAKLEFVWVPVDAPGGMNRVEIGDFSSKHPKEKKRSESIYAPFERNGKRGYYLGKTEVTEEQWAAVTSESARSKQPVAGKTYSEVQVFLDKLNRMVRESGGVPRTPDGAEGLLKLPTEAEWEYAARGAEAPRYTEQDPYGGDLERHEVFFLPSSEGKAREVASLPSNPLGLHDMLGNVRELMQENYSVGGASGGGFLLKGGSYLSERSELRSSARTEHQRLAKDGEPSRRPDAGLRLCLSAEIFTSLGSTFPEMKEVDGGNSNRSIEEPSAPHKRAPSEQMAIISSSPTNATPRPGEAAPRFDPSQPFEVLDEGAEANNDTSAALFPPPKQNIDSKEVSGSVPIWPKENRIFQAMLLSCFLLIAAFSPGFIVFRVKRARVKERVFTRVGKLEKDSRTMSNRTLADEICKLVARDFGAPEKLSGSYKTEREFLGTALAVLSCGANFGPVKANTDTLAKLKEFLGVADCLHRAPCHLADPERPKALRLTKELILWITAQ